MKKHQVDPVKVALRDMKSQSPKVRAFSADMLGQLLQEDEESLQRQEAAQALQTALQDPEYMVRYNAALSLAEIRVVEARPLLENALSDPHPMVRQGAAMALGELGDILARPVLEDALAQGTPEVRFQAVVSLAHLVGRESLPLLRSSLQDEDGEVRAQAVACLGDLNDRASSEKIVPLLTDPHPEARFESAYTLARFGDTRAVAGLMSFLGHKEHKWAACRQLGLLGDKRPILPLRKIRQSFLAPLNLRIEAAASILLLEAPNEEENAPKEKEFLLKQAKRRFGNERSLAIERLGEMGAPWARNTLLSLLKTPEDPGALDVAYALEAQWKTHGNSTDLHEFWIEVKSALEELSVSHKNEEGKEQFQNILRTMQEE